MWFLLLLSISLLDLVSSNPECTKFDLPQSGSCDKQIEWKTRTDEEALSICKDHFATTFVQAAVNSDRSVITCTVRAAYQCVRPDSFAIYDKCYEFMKTNGVYKTSTMNDLLTESPQNPICLDQGKPSTVLYTHARFLAKKANELGINKIWTTLTKDGNDVTNQMKIQKEIWKIEHDDHWDGNQLKAGSDSAQYVFMRTSTDHLRHRMQGIFEHATGSAEATFACEYEAHFAGDQEWYCNKMKELGIDAAYDDREGKERCLYLTTLAYQHSDTDLPACRESPSDMLHPSGWDDGTAQASIYNSFKSKEVLRIAAKRRNKSGDVRQGRNQTLTTDVEKLQNVVQWRLGHYRTTPKALFLSELQWSTDKYSYPRNENSAFTGESESLGVRDGKLIDLPNQVRAPAICSLRFHQHCEKNGYKCGDQECKNVKEYQKETEGFYTCQCPEHHDLVNQQCNWKGSSNGCAYLRYYGQPSDVEAVRTGPDYVNVEPWTYNDLMFHAVVRRGCTLFANTHGINSGFTHNRQTESIDVAEGGYGTHEIPNYYAGTLKGAWAGYGVSSYKCIC